MRNQSPSKIKLHRRSQILEIIFESDTQQDKKKSSVFELSAEYLRVFTPSAEVRGHGGTRIHGEHQGDVNYDYPIEKKNVGITAIDTQGNYGIRLHFNDTHNSGIYTWAYLHNLGKHYSSYWTSYLQQLHKRCKTREPNTQAVRLIDPRKD